MRFTVLGPVEVCGPDGPLQFRRAQHRAALAYLVLHSNRPVSNDELIRALWADTAPATAKAQVHNAVSALRTSLRAHAPGDVIVSAAAGYSLDAAASDVDLLVFRRLAAEARDQAGETAAATLRLALEQWRGTPLSGVRAAFVENARAQLHSAHADALEALYAIELDLGRHRRVVAEIGRAAELYPSRQRLTEHLMLALYRCGRQPEALEVYRTVRERLVRELGVDPARTLDEAHRRILGHDPSLMNVHSGLGRRFLPRDVPDFTGRADELAELDRLADAPTCATVVITAVSGAGGMGKTALAVHWAQRAAYRYPDGQLYLNLRGFDPRSPMSTLAALAALLRTLGVPEQRIPHDEDAAAALYRSTLAGSRVLVLLDNARTADQVRPLLPPGHGSLAIVTSRDAMLGLVVRDGARSIRLSALPETDAVGLLGEVVGDRVRAEPDSARRLAELCGRMPLALRLASADLLLHRDRSLSDAVSDLEAGDRLAKLSIADDDLSLRTVFGHSYAALPPAAARTFRLVALAPGTELTTSGVAALTAEDLADTRESLRLLAEASLLHATGPDRYELHDLLRLYARTMAGSVDGAATRHQAVERFIRHHLDEASAAVYAVSPHTVRLYPHHGGDDGRYDATAAMTWLNTEQETLVACVHHAAEHGPARLAWELADVLRGYFWVRRDVTVWEATASAGLRAATTASDPAAQAAMLLSLALAYRGTGRMDQAMDSFTDALWLARSAGWMAGEAPIVGSLGVVYAERGEMRRALEQFERALAINRRLGRTGSVAVNLSNIGGALLDLGELRPAADRFTEAIAQYDAIGSRAAAAAMQANLGIAQAQLGELDAARENLEHALAVHREFDDRTPETVALNALAIVLLRQGHLDRARRHAEGAIGVAHDIGDLRNETAATLTLARIRRVTGQIAEAASLAEKALSSIDEIGHRQFRAEALDLLAQLKLAQGDRAAGLPLAREALSICDSDGYQVETANALSTIAELEQSAEPARAALAICERIGYRPGLARARAAVTAAALSRRSTQVQPVN